MRRPLLALGLVGAVAAGAGGFLYWNGRPRPSTASLVVEPDPVVFGDVPWRDSPIVPVTISNRSDHEVLIRSVKFTCSCFAVLTPAPPALRPGASVTLNVQLFSKLGTPGRFHKLLIIQTDDPANATVETPVLGTISDYRDVRPAAVNFGALAPDADPASETIEVRGGSGYLVSVAAATASDTRLAVEVKAVENGANVVVRTVARPSRGVLSAQVKLELDVGVAGGARRRYTEHVRISGEFR